MDKIKPLREKIDHLDLEILSLLAKRRKIAKQIGKIKKRDFRAVIDKNRELEAIKTRIKKAKELKIPKKLVSGLFKLIFTDSRQIQKKMIHALTKTAKIDKI